jgi:two-component system response regulator PilR (NtrC family)
VNCGAIPTELMESELFGHKKGSFTGAIADKEGLIQSAEGGTLFLDEIADLPLHMQVKLLRVIQEKSVRPVGESKEIPIDVRILSATHKNLAALVAEAKFREDLFYRVNVIEIRVPPLRERPGGYRRAGGVDRQPARAADRQPRAAGDRGGARRAAGISLSQATCASSRTCWSARRHCARAESSTPATCSCARRSRTPKCRFRTPVAPGEKLGDALEDIERDAIVRALEQTRYNKTKACAAPRHDVQVAAVSDQEARYRVIPGDICTLCDAAHAAGLAAFGRIM